MLIRCLWEHNGSDTLLHAIDLPGASARGESLEEAKAKLPGEVRSYLTWKGESVPEALLCRIVQEAACPLEVRDGDSDVLYEAEKEPLTRGEYEQLKALALKSAADFLRLYESIPHRDESANPVRSTFYGAVPRTAREMYIHTKNVNAYYFGEIGVEADNGGTIEECRRRAFAALEEMPDFLENRVFEGSWEECWNLRKVLRRFLWHDRIHAKAMYRMALRTFGGCEDPFCFGVMAK